MLEHLILGSIEQTERLVLRGVVVGQEDETVFVVRLRQGQDEWIVSANLLVTAENPVRLTVGDSVLCWMESDHEYGVILGRLGGNLASTDRHTVDAKESPHHVDASAAVAHALPAEQIPETLVLEARKSITLRVGDGSITIRDDGKILIKGKDLVSHAQRMNRIKGGAVSIN